MPILSIDHALRVGRVRSKVAEPRSTDPTPQSTECNLVWCGPFEVDRMWKAASMVCPLEVRSLKADALRADEGCVGGRRPEPSRSFSIR